MRPPKAMSSVAFESRFHAGDSRSPSRLDAIGARVGSLRDAWERDDRQMRPAAAKFAHGLKRGGRVLRVEPAKTVAVRESTSFRN